jgi:hypothetical protein
MGTGGILRQRRKLPTLELVAFGWKSPGLILVTCIFTMAGEGRPSTPSFPRQASKNFQPQMNADARKCSVPLQRRWPNAESRGRTCRSRANFTMRRYRVAANVHGGRGEDLNVQCGGADGWSWPLNEPASRDWCGVLMDE